MRPTPSDRAVLQPPHDPTEGTRPFALTATSIALLVMTGCESLATIDRRTDERLRESAALVGEAGSTPRYDSSKYATGAAYPTRATDEDRPATVNPPVESLKVDRRDITSETAQAIIGRFNSMTEAPADATVLSFGEAMNFAQQHASEYLTAEETYIITALRLLIEEHRWGPTFFNKTSAVMTANADSSGRYTTALALLNDFGVSQRLPYGGEVSARFLVDATEQLDNAIGSDGQSAEVILSANIPLLRGAGNTADESRTQARRDLVYAAREFQQFRRSFYVDLGRDYLSLIFQKQQIANADRQVKRSQEVEERTVALVTAGRTEPFQADLARQNTLFAADRLAQLKENHRLAMDRFKLRLGMDTTRPIDVAASAFALPLPDVTLDGAVELALLYRLDLQTEADQVRDAERLVDVARNDLQGDLNLALSSVVPTDGTKRRSGLQFRPDRNDYVAGISYSMPLDRVAEEARYRESQIRLEQQRRSHIRFRDSVAVEARQSVRSIEKSQLSLLINERSVEASENRLAAIEAAPERATARDRTEAVNNLQRAQDGLEQARRDLQVAVLEYLEVTGQLRLAPDGSLALPRGLADAPAAPDTSTPAAP
ncbi:MAG: TolC family protein [Phycisphaerae bacterium]|nr:TolC family protein [Phycisphaerae bacterium]